MNHIDNLTLDELDRRIVHYENRLMDFVISEDEVMFIREALKELKSAKER